MLLHLLDVEMDRKIAFSAKKDAACETRPGGKWVCLRNPFTAGY